MEAIPCFKKQYIKKRETSHIKQSEFIFPFFFFSSLSFLSSLPLFFFFTKTAPIWDIPALTITLIKLS